LILHNGWCYVWFFSGLRRALGGPQNPVPFNRREICPETAGFVLDLVAACRHLETVGQHVRIQMPSQHLYLRMDIARLGRMVRHKWSFSLQEMLVGMNSLSQSQLSDICQSNIVEFNWHMCCTILVRGQHAWEVNNT
jgi:hypothetical protein